MSEIQGKPVFGVCECKEKVQVLSIDQVTDLIQQMAANNWQVPENYIPKTSVNGIIEQHSDQEIKLWVGTQAQYDELEDTRNLFAIISDDQTQATIETLLNQHGQSIENINNNISNIIDGTIIVTEAVNAQNAILNNDGTYSGFKTDANGVLKTEDDIIERKRLIFSGEKALTLNSSNNHYEAVFTGLNLQEGDKIQIVIQQEGASPLNKHVLGDYVGYIANGTNVNFTNVGGYYAFGFNYQLQNTSDGLIITFMQMINSSTSSGYAGFSYTPSSTIYCGKVVKIYKIIE